MNVPVFKRPKALEDVVHYAGFIGENNVDAAERFIVAAKETFEFIGRNPFIGPSENSAINDCQVSDRGALRDSRIT